jgi:hypothetical protein
MIGEDSNTEVLRQALTQVVGGSWRIAVEGAATSSPPRTTAVPRPAPPPVAEADPRDDTEPDSGDAPPADPETEAIKLLQAELGARPVES